MTSSSSFSINNSPLSSQLSVGVLLKRLDNIRLSEIDTLRRAGIFTLGDILQHNPTSLSNRVQGSLPRRVCAQLIAGVDAIVYSNNSSSSTVSNSSSTNTTTIKSLKELLQNNNNNQAVSTTSSSSTNEETTAVVPPLPWHFSKFRPTGVSNIDDIISCSKKADDEEDITLNNNAGVTSAGRVGGIGSGSGSGFPYGQISEIFALPGCGKTQLAMQIAAVASLNNNYFDATNNNSDSSTTTMIQTQPKKRNNQEEDSNNASSSAFGVPIIKIKKVPQAPLLVDQQQLHQQNDNNNNDANEILFISPPILVIDTEGSWSNERIECFRETLLLVNRNSMRTTEKNSNNEDAAAATPTATSSSSSEPPSPIIQFIRTTDLTVVTSALFLFRNQVQGQRERLVDHLVAEHLYRLGREQEEKERQQDDSSAQNVVGATITTNASRKSFLEREKSIKKIYTEKVRENYGGVIIIDSIAALMKENRINDNTLHKGTLLSLSSSSSNTSASADPTNSFNASSNSIAKTQTIAGFCRLLQSITVETNSATIVTNQMVKKTTMMKTKPNQLLNNNNNSSSIITYVPALGEVWSAVPSVRVTIKKPIGSHFTTQTRVLTILRGGAASSNMSFMAMVDDDEKEKGSSNKNKNKSSSSTSTSCRFTIDEDLVRALIPAGSSSSENGHRHKEFREGNNNSNSVQHHEAQRRTRESNFFEQPDKQQQQPTGQENMTNNKSNDDQTDTVKKEIINTINNNNNNNNVGQQKPGESSGNNTNKASGGTKATLWLARKR